MHYYDTVISGATVIDGLGGSSFQADIGITDDRISNISKFTDFKAHQKVDATGLVVAPGFIDVHTHDDRVLIDEPGMLPKISQGVTTVIAGNCGISLAPFRREDRSWDISPPGPMALLGHWNDYKYPSLAHYNAVFDAAPAACNVANLIGHSTLRASVMKEFDRAATNAEIDVMLKSLESSLSQGAIGLSTGLAYPTALHAPTEEVVQLCKSLIDFGAIYTTHMRNEEDKLIEAVDETIDIAMKTGADTVISHHKCAGRANWGNSRTTLNRISEAQQKINLDFDFYPYTAASTILLKKFLSTSEKTTLAFSGPHPEMVGRDFFSILEEWGCSIDKAVERLSPATAIYFRMDENELRQIMAYPGGMVGSDGLPVRRGKPHPRLWGTFPRILGHYCRKEGVLRLEDAVHRMTGKPAKVFGLRDRGEIREGAFADIVIFNPKTVIDKATYEEPETPAAGIERVYCNGELVWHDIAWTGARPGKRLKRITA
ncbi:MAG: D-aminoacylase [Magnetovibrio sp.]|nr:D-aminoacylase [Magnetovibrio sp.]